MTHAPGPHPSQRTKADEAYLRTPDALVVRLIVLRTAIRDFLEAEFADERVPGQHRSPDPAELGPSYMGTCCG